VLTISVDGVADQEENMNRTRIRHRMQRIPLFPFIPAVPLALLMGSFVTSLRALARVRRLERQVANATPVPA
jgi:hypothetical protein